ncbi:MAG: transaldolase [Chloroflexota bacterium]
MELKALLKLGQSPWMDSIERGQTRSGGLSQFIAEGIRGVTSNPSIFEKAIQKNSYEADIQRLARRGKSPFEIYDELSVTDVQEAADLFAPIWQESQGLDGYISLEPPAQYAYNVGKTTAEVKRLFALVNRENVMIKLPATEEGLKALPGLIASGININITLIFSPLIYAQVARGYIQGLKEMERQGGKLNRVASVASVFVSRIDTVVDKRLEALMAQETNQVKRDFLAQLRGKAAVANSKLIYRKYLEIFASSEFQALAKKGARIQRLLWGSTSTKNPVYSDVKYVEELIGKDTINTIPLETISAFQDHGRPKETISQGWQEAQKVIADVEALGISMEEIHSQLLQEGVAAFARSLDSLLATLGNKVKAGLAAR